MSRENKLGILANLILVMFMSFSISQALYTSLFMTNKFSLTVFITIVPLTFLLYVMFRNKISTLVSAIVVVILLLIGLCNISFKTGIDKTLNWIYGYSIWFIDVLNGYRDISYPLYTYITIIALAIIITLFVYFFSFKIYNFYVICTLLLSIFFVQLQFGIFLSKLSFVLFILSFLLYYFFDILKRRSNEKTYDVGNKLKYLIYILPICVIVIGMSLVFPIKSTRISFPWLDTRIDSAIKNISEKINNLFYDTDLADFDYFSINSTGFGKNDNLGGNITLSKTHVMNVKSEYSNLYLKANSKAFYNGHGWYDDNKQFIFLGNNLNKYSDKINSDSLEFTDGYLKTTAKDNYNDIYNLSNVQIEYVNLKTKSLFIPLKMNLLNLKSPQTLFYDNEQMIFSEKIQNKSFSYDLEYYNIMLNSDEFKNNIRKSYKGYYNDNIQVFKMNSSKILNNKISKLFRANNNISSRNSDTSTQDTSEYLNSIDIIYRKYTQLPNVVTPRVRQLAHEIAQGKGNNYDKAKAIESYLSNNYPYTLKPGNPPRRKDFVDYFLFEGKEGYCTYYASAMTVLLRCIDIPARYVEGYILPPESKNDVYKVTNQQAHAWVEAYFEGFGWIPFEPTSAFVSNMYNDKTISATVSSGMIDSGYDQYLEMINKYRNNESSISFDFEDINTESDTKTNTPIIIVIIASAFIGIILFAFGILAIINMLRYYRTLRRIRKGNPKNAVLFAYDYILKVLRLQNLMIQAGETPSQFGTRMEKTLDFKAYSYDKTSFIKITNHYIKARYSNADLLNDAQNDMLDFIDVLLKFTNEKFGRLKFAMFRYVLGKI